MAAEPRNVSGGTGWSKGDIVELVALIIGIPAAIGAIVMLATYYRRRNQQRRGETLFPQTVRGEGSRSDFSVTHTQCISYLCLVTHAVLQGRDQWRHCYAQTASAIGSCTGLAAPSSPSGERCLLTCGRD